MSREDLYTGGEAGIYTRRSGVRSVLVHTRTLTSQVITTRVSPVTRYQ